MENSSDSAAYIGLIIFIGLPIIVFISAKILSEKTDCIIIWGWLDFILFSTSLLLLTISMILIGDNSEVGTFIIAIGCLVLLASFVLTFVMNIKLSGPIGILYGFVAMISKLIVVLIFALAVLILFFSFWSGKSDKRFRDGTKNNEQTRNINNATGLLGSLVDSFIKK